MNIAYSTCLVLPCQTSGKLSTWSLTSRMSAGIIDVTKEVWKTSRDRQDNHDFQGQARDDDKGQNTK